jgi:2-polyprenyl-3-methyl-5-hydroxy-6-metoxy-1,4-benzoquinol methylase
VASIFDARAATWDDDPLHVARAAQVAAAVRAAVELGGHLRVLEYGAGTGLLSEQLAGDVGPITVTDPSAGMREAIAAKIAAGVVPGAQVADLDLSSGPVPTDRYDLIVTMMALHHVRDVRRVLAAFAELLEPGGTVCIADLDAEDGSFHASTSEVSDIGGHDHEGEAPQPESHHHDGFDRDELAEWLTAARFGPVTFTDASDVERNGRTYGIFLATARSLHPGPRR